MSPQGYKKSTMNQQLRSQAIPFIDIAAQRQRLGKAIDAAVSRVLDHCQFINGPEVMQLEAELAAFSGAKHVVACASGTDALLMVLMAKGNRYRLADARDRDGEESRAQAQGGDPGRSVRAERRS